MEFEEFENRNSSKEGNGNANHIDVHRDDISDGFKSKLDSLKPNATPTIETLYEKESTACVDLTEDEDGVCGASKNNAEANAASEINNEVPLTNAYDEMNVLEKVESPEIVEKKVESKSNKQALSNGNGGEQSGIIILDGNVRNETSDKLSEDKSESVAPFRKESNGENDNLANDNGYPTGECTNPGGDVTPAKSMKRKISLSSGDKIEAYPGTKKTKLTADKIDATWNDYKVLNSDACNGEISGDSVAEVDANYSAGSGSSQDIRDFKPSRDSCDFDPLQDACNLVALQDTRDSETPDMSVNDMSEVSLFSEEERDAVQPGNISPLERQNTESDKPNTPLVEEKSDQLAQPEGILSLKNVEAEIDTSKMAESKFILESQSVNSEVTSAIEDSASSTEKNHLVENTMPCRKIPPGSVEVKISETCLPLDSDMVQKLETTLAPAELKISLPENCDVVENINTQPAEKSVTESSDLAVDNSSFDEISSALLTLTQSKTEVADGVPQKSDKQLLDIPVERESRTLYNTPFYGFEEEADKEELRRLEEINMVLKKLEEMRNQPDNIWKRVAVRTHSSAHERDSDSDDAKLYICEDMPENVNGDTSQHPKMRIKAARKRKLSQKARLNLESAASPDATKLPRPSIKARISLKTESYSIVDDSQPTNGITPLTSTKNNHTPAASRKTKLDSSSTLKLSPPKKKHLKKATEVSSNPAFALPFEYGWKRELVYRSFSNSDTRSTRGADVYYYSPEGMKFRSSKQIASLLPPDGPLSPSNFTFSKDPVLFDKESDNEVVRDANEAKPKFLQDFISNIRKTKTIRKPRLLLNPKLGQQGVNNGLLSDGSPLSPDVKNKMPKIMFRSIAKGTPKQKRPVGKNSIGANSNESSSEFEMGTLPPGWSPSDESFNSTASEYTTSTTNLSSSSIPSSRKIAALKMPLKTKVVANSAAKHSATSTPIRTISAPSRVKAVSAKATSTTTNSSPNFDKKKIIPNAARSAMQNHINSIENNVQDAECERLHSLILSLLEIESNRRLDNDAHRSHVINAINLDRTAEKKETRRQSHVVDIYFAPITLRTWLTGICITFVPTYNSLVHSFTFLRVDEIAAASRTNKLFQMAAYDMSLWHSVCLKNVKVKNWDGFRKCLTQRGTKRVDLRKTLSRIPNINPHEPMPPNSVSGALISIPTLRHIDFGQCDTGLFEYVISMVPTLKVVNAQSLRSNVVSCEALGKLKAPRDLRLRSAVGLVLTSHIQNINHFNDIVVLSLTSVRNLKTDFFHVVKQFMKLESLSLGECTDIEWNEAASCLVNLSMLRKLRIEKVANNDPDYPLLKAVGDMPSITCLELINFEVKSDFDLAIAYCTNLTHLLIIPTYMTQSATTNQLVINGIKELTNLKQFVWSLTLELLKVTDLFMDQWQNQVPYAKPKQFTGEMPESIPILKSKPGPGQTGATQVDILPITKLESILERLLPQTSITIERIPFSTSWKRNIPQNTLLHPTPGLP